MPHVKFLYVAFPVVEFGKYTTARCQEWTSDVMSKLEQRKIVIAPLCLKNHWFLLTVQTGRIIVFDSVPGGPNKNCKERRRHLVRTVAKLMPACSKLFDESRETDKLSKVGLQLIITAKGSRRVCLRSVFENFLLFNQIC